MAAGEVFLEVGGGMQVDAFAAEDTDDEDVLLVRNAALTIVDDLAIAIEGEAKFNVATDVEDSNGLVGRCNSGEALGKGTRGVRTVEEVDDAFGCADLGNTEERAYALEQEHEDDENAGGDETQAGNAESLNDDEDEG